ncbi:MAG: class I SAM-dependent methyltransferase [Bacteroidales bacterium]|jgi:demethylmenaquinone methyltransferase/2-methoxy-6-polyprenyl-1,4-benzoquinol methylase|nr:class I SAM-dependent methyltransferase [Bacteroidales bacterium]
MSEFDIYENLTRFREPLIRRIIESLVISPDSKGIDVGCGIGRITNLLYSEKNLNKDLIGLDLSYDKIQYAKKYSKYTNIKFVQGDVNKLNFKSNSFDWIWSMDTIWIGPKESGCPAEKPDKILNELNKILIPGGKLYLAFWSSQKLLPGYPLLEARLNSTISANTPYLNDMNPNNHILCVKKWLKDANFKDIKVKSFVGDIAGSLSENDKKAVSTFFEMLWNNSEREVSKKDWDKFNELCSSESDKFILNDPNYYGFYIYTLFNGTKI